MKLNVLYFAQLREKFGVSQESIEVSDQVRTIADLVRLLAARGGAWQEELGGTLMHRFAINQEMVDSDATLSDYAEVAIFRPVTGG